ncbi:hypothetical protein [Streptomyces griseoloalbus]|uniref:Uncharacterized protein n=1 Tax=Streptomyces griseoloalbus TaxID=67303 RepID=A0A7W8F7S0_9ACTN|nr:hypothetical protein [Streptomyces albaduncus]MBB5126378.1 hypothetical protein [Streptomyces albaduncus]
MWDSACWTTQAFQRSSREGRHDSRRLARIAPVDLGIPGIPPPLPDSRDGSL